MCLSNVVIAVIVFLGTCRLSDSSIIGRQEEPQEIEDTATEEALYRAKRSFRLNGRWPDNCIPYNFDPAIPEDVEKMIRGYMGVLEKNTCIRFFEKATNITDHSSCAPTTGGYLYIKLGSTGSSYVGYSSVSGQVVYVTSSERVTVHEFGHLLGNLHEIEYHAREPYINVMIDNVGPSHWNEMDLMSQATEMKYDTCEWSMQSVMMYTQTYYSRHGYNMYNTHYTNMGDPFDVASSFYFYKDISVNHQCCETGSCTSLTCANEGYMGSYDGTCQCICPAGFDTDSNCAEIQSSSIPATQWPGSWSSLAPRSGCPGTGFKLGVRFSSGSSSLSSGHHIISSSMDDLTMLSFCTYEANSNTDSWQPGNYCILKATDFNCEDNSFESGSILINEAPTNGFYATGFDGLPSGMFGAFGEDTEYDVCCRDDGIKGINLNLPNEKSFTLFKVKGSVCQEVEGMSVHEESVTFDQEGPGTITGTLLDAVEDSATNAVTLSYCYYEPLDYSCGGVYTIDPANPSQIFSSPNHPSQYGTNQDCTWAFVAPLGSQVQMTCSGIIDIAENEIFTIRKKTFGEKAVSPLLTPDKRFPPMLSIKNKLAVNFRSGSDAGSNSGFTCMAKFADELEQPYSNLHSGEDYCGVMNYASSELGFSPCIPWAQVFESDSDLFSGDEESYEHYCPYESNYCRNVGGKKHGPVCVTALNKKNVTLMYCDTAQYVAPFDLLDDCPSTLADDSECEDSETIRTCFQSCLAIGKITDYPAKEPVASSVTCGQPTLSSDVFNDNYDSTGYSVGTMINIKCSDSDNQRHFMCLSNGQWSTETNFCAGCPTGTTEVNGECRELHSDGCPSDTDDRSGNCYKLLPLTYNSGDEARAACESLGYFLAYPQTSTEITDVFQVYIDEVLPGNTANILLGYRPNLLGNDFIIDSTGESVPANMWEFGVPTGSNMFFHGAVLEPDALLVARITLSLYTGRALCQSPSIPCPADYVKPDGCYKIDETCPSGYDNRGGNCYKIITTLLTGILAKDRCQSENTFLACPANADDFTAMQDYYTEKVSGSGRKLWIGAEPNLLGNAWYCENTGAQMIGPYWGRFADTGPTGSVKYTHIAWMLHDTHASTPRELARTKINNNAAYPMCQATLGALQVPCGDYRTDCSTLLSINPRMRDNNAFSIKYCKKSSGLCEPDFCFAMTQTGVSVDSVLIETGDYGTFSCAAGYRHDGTGNIYRACLSTGLLTGTEIGCNPVDQSTRQLNYIPIQDDNILTDPNLIMTGPSPAYSFTESSSVLACRAFCKEDAEITLQIWKQTPNEMPRYLTLVDQREVTCVGRRANTWEFDTPIPVNNGDFLGVLDKTGGAIPYHSCYKTQNLDGHNKIRFSPFDPQQSLVVGTSYDFNTQPTHYHAWYPRCYVYSVDCIVKPDTMTGTANVNFNQ